MLLRTSLYLFFLILFSTIAMALSRKPSTPPHLCTRTDLFPICGVFQATDNSGISFALPSAAGEFTIGRDLRCSLPFVGTDLISNWLTYFLLSGSLIHAPLTGRLHCKLENSVLPGGASYLISVTDTSKNGTLVSISLPSSLYRFSFLTLNA